MTTTAETAVPSRLAILGAGPVGLEAALAAAEAGLPFTVYEAAAEPAAHVRAWGHVRLFSPWDLDVSPRMRRALAAAGREVPAGGACPTGAELVERVLDPVARLPQVAAGLALGRRVVAVGREGLRKHREIATAERGRRPFRLLVADGDGRETVERAAGVLDCTGTYGHPNSLGDGGIPAPGERALDGRIRRHLLDLAAERDEWAGKTVLLAGGGHSAQTALRGLAELAAEAPGTRVVWLLPRAPEDWTIDPGDPLPERRRLAEEAREIARTSPAVEVLAGARVEAIAEGSDGRLRAALGGTAAGREVAADRVLSLTGYLGDRDLHRQLQVHQCYATEGPMKLSAALLGAGSADCLTQTSHGLEALAVPEPGFFLLGAKSYGRVDTFLMRVGWQQVDEVMPAVADRLAAAAAAAAADERERAPREAAR